MNRTLALSWRRGRQLPPNVIGGRMLKRSLFFILCLLVCNTYSRSMACSGSSPNLTAANASFAEVDACASIAVNGDTITIPAGSATWTTGLVLPDGVSITGTGTPSSDPLSRLPSASCDDTIITIDGVVGFTATPDYGDAATRISCMHLFQGTTGRAFTVQGTCTSSGCPDFRLDNILFDDSWAGGNHLNNGYGIGAVTNVFGVIDHNEINGAATAYTHLVQFYLGNYLGTGTYGDYAWTQPEDYGTNKFLFIENNTFNTSGCCESEGSAFADTSRGGGKIVVRFNDFNVTENLNFVMGFHGTESGGRERSPRAFEFYGNDITCDPGPCDQIAGARGGTGLVWGNSVTKVGGINTFFTLTTYRMMSNLGGWGVCDGSSPYDENDGMVYWSGTVTSGAGAYTIGVSGSPGWTTDQWIPNGAPYSLHNVTLSQGTEIVSNTSDTLTLRAAGPGPWIEPRPLDEPPYPGQQVGDSIQILRATRCIDQAGGVGAGIMYNDTNPATPTDPVDQISSPIYAFMNVFSGGGPTYCADSVYGGICPLNTRVIPDRDFYTESLGQAAQTSASSPFNGTSGVGHGTFVSPNYRPTTCTDGAGTAPGVGYFATDEGSWNTSGNGFGNGRLYLCTSADTWTLSYTPYNYPHPLISGESPGGGPPVATKVMIR